MRVDAEVTPAGQPGVSLCYPDAPHHGGGARLSRQAAEDIGIAAVRERFGLPEEFLYELCQDVDTIGYRQRILADLLASDELCGVLREVRPMLRELAYFRTTRKEQSAPLQQAVWRLGELETYVSCLQRLADAAALSDLKSQGMQALLAFVERRRADPVYQRLVKELPALRGGLKRRASVSIGINLDDQLRPAEATLLAVHDEKFAERPLLSRIFGAATPYQPVASIKPLAGMGSLLGDLDRILGAVARPLARALGQYVRLQVQDLLSLEREIAFYLGAAQLFGALRARGLPVCRPRLAGVGERHLQVTGLYNVNLALGGSEEAARAIVGNDLDMAANGRILVLTGPNQGGKTTFARAVGLLQVLAQAGLYAPAASAVVSPADVVETHFPVDEPGHAEGGRLAEEARRLASIFAAASEHSLILMNESLASTSPSESLYLADDVVRGLRLLGARAVFATHLHELGERVDAINREVAGASRLVSMVAGIESSDADNGSNGEVRRTYRIRPGPPVGLSYARDIARRYGISFDDIRAQLAAKQPTPSPDPAIGTSSRPLSDRRSP